MKNPLLLALLFTFACGAGKANDNAHKFAKRHWGDKVKSVECVSGINADSDDNGYVSCAVFLTDGTEKAIECATEHPGSCQSGCKMMRGYR